VALLIVLGGPFVGFGAGASPVSASAVDDEQIFVQLINQLRADEGLAPLAVDAELRSSARSWTASMASNDALAHSPDMTVGITAPWTVLGENVGERQDLDNAQVHGGKPAGVTPGDLTSANRSSRDRTARDHAATDRAS